MAIDSVAKAVARIDDGVRLATIAPAGPVIAAQKNAPRQSTPTWAGPLGSRKPTSRKTIESRQKAIDASQVRIGTFSLIRSVIAPLSTMPIATTSTTSPAKAPAAVVDTSYSRTKKLGSQA